MRFEICGIDHDRLGFRALSGQTRHDAGEHAHLAPLLPAIIQCLVRAVFLGRITPPQPIAIYEDYATQNAPVINARYAMALGEEGFQTLHLRVSQPEKIAH